MANESDIITAKFIMGMFGLIISGAVVAHALANDNESFLKEGLLLSSNIVMFFLGRSTARVPAAQLQPIQSVVAPPVAHVAPQPVQQAVEPVEQTLGKLKEKL